MDLWRVFFFPPLCVLLQLLAGFQSYQASCRINLLNLRNQVRVFSTIVANDHGSAVIPYTCVSSCFTLVRIKTCAYPSNPLWFWMHTGVKFAIKIPICSTSSNHVIRNTEVVCKTPGMDSDLFYSDLCNQDPHENGYT